MKQVIETHLPRLSRPQLTGLVPVSSTGLVLWVCGTIPAGSACRNAAAALSTWGNRNNMRQYLREWLYGGGGTPLPDGTGRKPLLRAAAAMGPFVAAFRGGVSTGWRWR